MKLIKRLLIITAIFSGLAASILFGITAGSEKGKIQKMGARQDGHEIVSEQIRRYRIYPLSAEGLFYRAIWDYTFFYEQNGDKKTKLAFLTDKKHHYELLKPILPISNSDRWAAFRLSYVEKEKVNLIMYIFDSKRIHTTFEIKDVIRVSTCGWSNADSYSVAQSGTDGTITINTLHGLVTFDQNSNELVIVGADVSKQRP